MANGNDSQNPGNKVGAIARAAMWLGGSALFGSLALVLWNRRTLRRLHDVPEAFDSPPLPSDDDIY
jgi:hypothetical protein